MGCVAPAARGVAVLVRLLVPLLAAVAGVIVVLASQPLTASLALRYEFGWTSGTTYTSLCQYPPCDGTTYVSDGKLSVLGVPGEDELTCMSGYGQMAYGMACREDGTMSEAGRWEEGPLSATPCRSMREYGGLSTYGFWGELPLGEWENLDPNPRFSCRRGEAGRKNAEAEAADLAFLTDVVRPGGGPGAAKGTDWSATVTLSRYGASGAHWRCALPGGTRGPEVRATDGAGSPISPCAFAALADGACPPDLSVTWDGGGGVTSLERAMNQFNLSRAEFLSKPWVDQCTMIHLCDSDQWQDRRGGGAFTVPSRYQVWGTQPSPAEWEQMKAAACPGGLPRGAAADEIRAARQRLEAEVDAAFNESGRVEGAVEMECAPPSEFPRATRFLPLLFLAALALKEVLALGIALGGCHVLPVGLDSAVLGVPTLLALCATSRCRPRLPAWARAPGGAARRPRAIECHRLVSLTGAAAMATWCYICLEYEFTLYCVGLALNLLHFFILFEKTAVPRRGRAAEPAAAQAETPHASPRQPSQPPPPPPSPPAKDGAVPPARPEGTAEETLATKVVRRARNAKTIFFLLHGALAEVTAVLVLISTFALHGTFQATIFQTNGATCAGGDSCAEVAINGVSCGIIDDARFVTDRHLHECGEAYSFYQVGDGSLVVRRKDLVGLEGLNFPCADYAERSQQELIDGRTFGWFSGPTRAEMEEMERMLRFDAENEPNAKVKYNTFWPGLGNGVCGGEGGGGATSTIADGWARRAARLPTWANLTDAELRDRVFRDAAANCVAGPWWRDLPDPEAACTDLDHDSAVNGPTPLLLSDIQWGLEGRCSTPLRTVAIPLGMLLLVVIVLEELIAVVQYRATGTLFPVADEAALGKVLLVREICRHPGTILDALSGMVAEGERAAEERPWLHLLYKVVGVLGAIGGILLPIQILREMGDQAVVLGNAEAESSALLQLEILMSVIELYKLAEIALGGRLGAAVAVVAAVGTAIVEGAPCAEVLEDPEAADPEAVAETIGAAGAVGAAVAEAVGEEEPQPHARQERRILSPLKLAKVDAA